MSAFFTLTPHVFFSTVSASVVGSWIPLDYRSAPIQQRSLSGSKTADADQVIVELMTSANTTAGTVVQVIATATIWASGASVFSAVIQGPAKYIRGRKQGTGGAATLVGMI